MLRFYGIFCQRRKFPELAEAWARQISPDLVLQTPSADIMLFKFSPLGDGADDEIAIIHCQFDRLNELLDINLCGVWLDYSPPYEVDFDFIKSRACQAYECFVDAGPYKLDGKTGFILPYIDLKWAAK